MKEENNNNLIVAIDADTSKSGVALLRPGQKSLTINCLTLAEIAYELIPSIQSIKKKVNCQVLIESIAHTSANFRIREEFGNRKSSAMGVKIGRCSEIQSKIVELFAYHGIKVELIYPLRKCWNGPDNKITHSELATLYRNNQIPFPRSSNQEKRDAALIALAYSGLPLKL